jgi:cytochrome c oxidase subunit 1
MDLHRWILYAAVGLGLSQIPFIINLFYSINNGRKVTSDNPWNATTLEWQTPTPPPHGNFATPPHVYRGPYEYSLPGKESDFTPQNEPDEVQTKTQTAKPATTKH